MFSNEVLEKINDEFGIDVEQKNINSSIVDIVFVFDWSKKEDAEIVFIRGDYQSMGIFKSERPKIKDFFKYLEINNPVSEIYGKEGYVDRIVKDLNNLDKINEFYLPYRNNGKITWVCLSVFSLTKIDGINEKICGKVNWISERTPRAILYYQSKFKDNETNLFTKESLRLHLSMVKKTDYSFGLFFDIDNFKRINDVFGHKSGDLFLKQLADKLISDFDPKTIYYRMGGDEFFVYLCNSTAEKAYRKALDIVYLVETLNPEGQQVEVSASIGIVPIIGDKFDFETLVDSADKAMYHSKGKGKGNISYSREV